MHLIGRRNTDFFSFLLLHTGKKVLFVKCSNQSWYHCWSVYIMLQQAVSCAKASSWHKQSINRAHKSSIAPRKLSFAHSYATTAKPVPRSTFFAPIHWDAPNDAVIVSHKLLVQAGFVKKVRQLSSLVLSLYCPPPLSLSNPHKMIPHPIL
jgi:hypothetical protein